MALSVVIYVDGGSRGNPGPSGYGVVVTDVEGTELETLHQFLGHHTNNFAEYSGLVAGLERAAAMGARQVEVRADSELMVRQMLGAYQVRSESLRPLFEEARRLARGFDHFTITHVRREKNRVADELANLAMDGAQDAGARARTATATTATQTATSPAVVWGEVRGGKVVTAAAPPWPEGTRVTIRRRDAD